MRKSEKGKGIEKVNWSRVQGKGCAICKLVLGSPFWWDVWAAVWIKHIRPGISGARVLPRGHSEFGICGLGTYVRLCIMARKLKCWIEWIRGTGSGGKPRGSHDKDSRFSPSELTVVDWVFRYLLGIHIHGRRRRWDQVKGEPKKALLNVSQFNKKFMHCPFLQLSNKSYLEGDMNSASMDLLH